MKRTPLLVGVVAFIVVDVVLVALALRSAQGPEAPPTADRSVSAPSEQQSPPDNEADNQSGNESGNAPTEPGTTPEPDRGAPLLLAAGGGDTVLRATPGSCDGDPAGVTISSDGGATFDDRDSPAQVVLRLDVTSLADMWMAGLDDSCEPTFYRSGDGAQSWEPTEGTQGAWHLLPGDAQTLHGPDGDVDLPCTPVALSSVDFAFAAAGCANGDLVTTNSRGNRWRSVGSVDDVVDLEFADRQRGYALSVTADCSAAVSGTTDGGRSWQELSCIAAAAPGRSMALSSGDLLVQTGRALHVSDDDGSSWQRL